MLEMIPLKQCPFCGADAEMKWVLDDTGAKNGHGGKSIRVSCSRDGECPSPEWMEVCNEHESDADCMISVAGFWNTRAEEWEPGELLRLRVKLVQVESELRLAKIERDRAMKACEKIAQKSRPDPTTEAATD